MSFCLCRWGRMALILFFLMVPACGPASAAYHFLGIGNDGYINDVNGLWGRMNLWANWSAQPAANNRIRENLSGGSILEELDALAGRLAPGDLGLFFYSGHMYSYAADDNGDETATGSAALNPYEERMGLRGNPWDRASDDAIAAALSGTVDGATLVVVVDACHAGGLIGGSGDLQTVDNLYFMGAAQEDEEAYASTPYSRFTNGLVWGIEGTSPADADSDGLIYADEWFSFAARYALPRQHPLSLSNLNPQTNIPLFSPVPIPGTWILLGTMIVAVLASKKNRRLG